MSANRPEPGRLLRGGPSRDSLNGGRPNSDQPSSSLPESGPPDEAAADAVTALCASALRLLSAARQTPARLRLAAGTASVEIEWPAAATAPGPADSQLAARRAQHLVESARQDLDEPGRQDQDQNHDHDQNHDRATAPCIRAPMVGTFYHAAEPGSAPFVRAGDIVEAGQQVGILEVMKLMTPVQADQRTRVVEFLVPDASPVEHGQPLISCASL